MKFCFAVNSVVLLLLCSSCSTLSRLAWWQDVHQESDSGPEVGDSSANEIDESDTESGTSSFLSQELISDTNLSLARVVARVNELERDVRHHKAKIQVLEKAVLLGMVPEELLNDSDETYRKSYLNQSPPAISSQSDDPVAPPGPEATPLVKSMDQPMDSEEQRRSYEEVLARAQENFRMGRYGAAVHDFTAIGRDFGALDRLNNHKYWVGLCWFHLREYETARDGLASFVESGSGSPWIPRAKLYLAKSEKQLGLHERALRRFQDIIEEYPQEDAAEMAKLEIRSFKEKL